MVDFVFCVVSTFFVCSENLAMFWCESLTLKSLVLVLLHFCENFLSEKTKKIIVPTINRELSVLDDCDNVHDFLSLFLPCSPNLGRVTPKVKSIRKLSEDNVVTQKNSVQDSVQVQFSVQY